MAYARVTFTAGNLGALEIGMDSLDDPAVAEVLVKNITLLWKIAEADVEDE